MREGIVKLIKRAVPGVMILLGLAAYIIGIGLDKSIEKYYYSSGLISSIYDVQMKNGDIRKRAVVRYRVGEKVYEWEMDEFLERAYKQGEIAQIYYNKEDPSDVINITRYELLSKRGDILQFFGWTLIGSGVLLYLYSQVQKSV